MTYLAPAAIFACLLALTTLAPLPLAAQSSEPLASTRVCMLMGKTFSRGATVRMTGERVRCHGNSETPDTLFWNRDVDGDENRNSFVMCVYGGEFYSQGAVVEGVTCNGNGNWD